MVSCPAWPFGNTVNFSSLLLPTHILWGRTWMIQVEKVIIESKRLFVSFDIATQPVLVLRSLDLNIKVLTRSSLPLSLSEVNTNVNVSITSVLLLKIPQSASKMLHHSHLQTQLLSRSSLSLSKKGDYTIFPVMFIFL